MSTNSKIEWCDVTWNPTRGCSVISPGCTNCYAMKQAHRFSGKGQPYEGLTKSSNGGPVWTGEVRLVHDALTQPLRWRKPRRVFVDSMSDLFHEDVPDQFIDEVFAVMALCPQHQFLILTKRALRMKHYLSRLKGFSIISSAAMRRHGVEGLPDQWPLPNVWLGVSTENQQYADHRIPYLLETPAAVRFVSAEPLLGPIDFSKWLKHCYECEAVCGWRAGQYDPPPDEICNTCGETAPYDSAHEFCGSCGTQDFSGLCPRCGANTVQDHPETVCLDWIIVGGESGPGARPMNLSWARDIRDHCRGARTAFFMKQIDKKTPIPEDLMVRQYPETNTVPS